ncbi:amidase [Ramlibacter tataouinensis]|uniref:Amidase-like protein n=1 Tax=Ramlibacter tataouinensis (strain ATCC BAA-407 / DSM 14655 / LMG 21543 / TTB310) TaxID=365046 RepID=F5XVR9_RAMTT|nr:amidase [Ramlibacter tataouinensis]AEG92832.1 amidase-like protein [Ramlibacter tataouinensis TTB310]
MSPHAQPPHDLIATLERIRAGRGSTAAELDRALEAADSPVCAPAFLKTFRDQALQQAADPARQALPLGGLPVSVKDLFDLAGQPTPAGSRVLADAPAAQRDAPAVARLKAAGATVLGRTHMTEFAFSGVGTNPHFRTPANPADAATPRIPGGSSSGAAVSVAGGAAFIGLGSDTGGSIRIPAALCGIVGFKNTQRLTPLEGALPLSATLDTVCAMTRSVRDAILAHEILAGRQVVRSTAPLRAYRLAVPCTQMLDGLDATVAAAFERALDRLRSAGATVQEIELDAIRDLGSIQATGGFSAAESFAWHRSLLEARGDGYDPRVRARIERGAGMKAHEYLELIRARRDWIARVEASLRGFDAVLSPTVPIVAPPIAQVAPGDASRDEAFFRVNALLLRNPSVVNMLDGCAISIPCHGAGELPVGLMIWQSAMRDDTVLNVAQQAETALASITRP